MSETSSSVQWKLDLSSTCYTLSLRHTHMHTRIHSHRHRHFSFPVSVKVGLPFYNRSVPLAWRFQSFPYKVLDERNLFLTPPPKYTGPSHLKLGMENETRMNPAPSLLIGRCVPSVQYSDLGAASTYCSNKVAWWTFFFFALGRLITILMKINDFYLDLCALFLSVNLQCEMCGYLWCLQLLFLILKGKV